MLEQWRKIRAVQEQQAHHAAAGVFLLPMCMFSNLIQLAQDGLGGNAKTLMFVNVSPSEYNADETANSLT